MVHREFFGPPTPRWNSSSSYHFLHLFYTFDPTPGWVCELRYWRVAPFHVPPVYKYLMTLVTAGTYARARSKANIPPVMRVWDLKRSECCPFTFGIEPRCLFTESKILKYWILINFYHRPLNPVLGEYVSPSIPFIRTL
jgi:hypothetical protein